MHLGGYFLASCLSGIQFCIFPLTLHSYMCKLCSRFLSTSFLHLSNGCCSCHSFLLFFRCESLCLFYWRSRRSFSILFFFIKLNKSTSSLGWRWKESLRWRACRSWRGFSTLRSFNWILLCHTQSFERYR